MTTKSGYKLAVFEQGQGEPVVLLHGQISTHNYMGLVAKQISSQKRAISLDLLGFGDSPRPKDCEYTIDDHVAAIVNALAEYKVVTPFTLVGHSMGALIAVRLAKIHPELVKSLILSALPVMPAGREYQTLAKEFPGTRAIMKGIHAKLVHKLYERNEQQAQRLAVKLSKRHYGHLAEQIRADTVRHSWEAYDRSMKQVISYNSLQDLKNLSIPVVIIHGAQDYISRDIVGKKDVLARPNIRLISIVDAKHNIPLIHPDVVAKAILQV